MKPHKLTDDLVEKSENRGIVAVSMAPSPSESSSSASLGASPLGEQDLLDAAATHLYGNYAQPGLVFERGEGARLFDRSGKKYIDLFAGIAVSALGHGNSRLVAAISEQAQKLIHLSNYFYNEPNVQLASSLCQRTQMDRALFCNSGTEANEAALKLARRYFFDRGETERHVILAFENSFHGRTMGALAATGQPKYRTGFGPLPEVRHVPYGDLDAVRSQMDGRVAAILVEPIQGEGGVLVPSAGFIPGLRSIADQCGALLIADEIQTGVARTGRFLGFEHEGVQADIVTLAKGLGGGVPIGAMLCKEALAGVLVPGSHGTTFGGNPLASAAALSVLQQVDELGLVERAASLGIQLEKRLDLLVDKHACVAGRRGRGLLQALVLAQPEQGGAILGALREAGALITLAGGTALRLTPPLTISDEELEEGLSIIDQVLDGFS